MSTFLEYLWRAATWFSKPSSKCTIVLYELLFSCENTNKNYLFDKANTCVAVHQFDWGNRSILSNQCIGFNREVYCAWVLCLGCGHLPPGHLLPGLLPPGLLPPGLLPPWSIAPRSFAPWSATPTQQCGPWSTPFDGIALQPSLTFFSTTGASPLRKVSCQFGAFSLARASLARASLTWPTLARFHFGAFHFDAFSSHTILFSLISLYSCPIWERVRYMRKLRLCTKLRYCLPRRHFMICGTCTTTTSTSTHVESISWAASFYLCCITMNTYQCVVSCILYYTITATFLATGSERLG